MIGGHLANKSEEKNTEKIILSARTKGGGSYNLRPKGKDNLTIAVMLGKPDPKEIKQLESTLRKVQQQGGKTGLIALLDDSYPEKEYVNNLKRQTDISFIMDFHSENDPLGIIPSILLKQVLNMISNATMIKMNKIIGNIMIDVSPSNYKLIARVLGSIKTLYQYGIITVPLPSQEKLYESVITIKKLKTQIETHERITLPPTIRILIKMLENNCNEKQAIEMLKS